MKSDECVNDYDASVGFIKFFNSTVDVVLFTASFIKILRHFNTAILVNDMRLQFTRLNLNENESNEKNILSNQDIRYYQNLFPSTTCKSSSVASGNQGPYPLCLPLNTLFDTDIDLAQYFAILNYLKDCSICASPIKLEEHRIEQHLTTDTLTETDIDGCWKVYDSNGQCFCC